MGKSDYAVMLIHENNMATGVLHVDCTEAGADQELL